VASKSSGFQARRWVLSNMVHRDYTACGVSFEISGFAV
jgi:hypothetical protein